VLLFAGCPLPTGEDWVEPVDVSPASYGIVIDYNLRNYVPAPFAGGYPTWSLTQGDVKVSVVWKDSAGNPLSESVLKTFTKGVEYRAEITLVRRENHAFAADIEFAYPKWMVQEQKESRDAEAEGRRVVAVTYFPAPAQPLSESEIIIPLPFVPEN
jgi:hypothetical protein